MSQQPRASTLRHGQELMGKAMNAVPYTEQEMEARTADALIGTPDYLYAKFTPLGLDKAGQTRIINYSSPNLSSYFKKERAWVAVRLPSVLKSLSIVYEKGGGTTTYDEVASATATGAFSVGLGVSGTAQASATVMPKPVYDLQNYSRDRMQVWESWLYADTLTAILAKLTTEFGASVLAWPNFKERAINLFLRGEKVNGTARATYQASASLGGGGGSVTQSDGIGYGKDSSVDIGQLQIPPSLHAAFSLTASDTESHSGTASVSISGGALTGGGSGTATALATASVTPTSIAATSPTDIPSSGLYLYDLNLEYNETLNATLVHAIVVDFADL